MASFKIKGGKRLSGSIIPQGAKNEALQVLCAVLLTDSKVVINNLPDIIDVNNLISILKKLGVSINRLDKGSYEFQTLKIDKRYLQSDQFKVDGKSLRGSIMLIGPLLGRFGFGSIPRPGGDKIGRRRLDTHFDAFINLGADFNYDKESYFYTVKSKNLKGADILLEEPSVTGTANILMASVLAKGKTVIYNAACEPYLQQLSKMLVSMGANISGIGSNRLIVNGVKKLKGTSHTLLPDMVEIGSWIGLAAMTKSELTIKNVRWEYLGQIPSTFKKLGINIEKVDDDIYIPCHKS